MKDKIDLQHGLKHQNQLPIFSNHLHIIELAFLPIEAYLHSSMLLRICYSNQRKMIVFLKIWMAAFLMFL